MIRKFFVKINFWSKQFLKFLKLQDEYQDMTYTKYIDIILRMQW